MSCDAQVAIARWPSRAPPAQDGLAEPLAAYHLQTQAEKGEAVAGVEELPDLYQVEIADPQSVFVDDVVLLALSGDTAVGCLVVTAAVDGRPRSGGFGRTRRSGDGASRSAWLALRSCMLRAAA